MAVADSTPQGVTGIKQERIWDSAWLNTKFILGSSVILLIILFGVLGPLFLGYRAGVYRFCSH